MNAPHHDHHPRVRAAAVAAAKARRAPTKHHELLRLVCALSGACRSDSNVLRDAQLVDLLESQAKTILQSRRQKAQQLHNQQRRKSATAGDLPTISPQRTKLIKKLADANAESSSVAASKRRKLSFESETQKRPASPIKVAMPLRSLDTAFASKSKSDPAAAAAGTCEATDAFAAASSAPVAVFRAGVVDYSSSSSSSSALSHQQQPPFFKSDDAATAPFKSLDHASVNSVDLSASMASTVASTSAGYYDDLSDDLGDSRYRRAHSPGMDSRGSHSPMSELTQSVDSIDWSPSDDDDEADDDELATHAAKTARSATPLGFDTSDAAAAVPVTPEMASSTEVVMQVLYSIMRQDHKYKWLVDPENQARVAKLVAYHQHQQQQQQESEGERLAATSATAAAAAATAPPVDLQTRVDELTRENERLAEANAMSACDIDEQQRRVQTLLAQLQTATAAAAPAPRRTDAETRLVATEAQLQAQEAMRREAEAAFSSALNAKNATVTSLKHDVAAKETEVESLMEHVDAISAAFVAKTCARSETPSAADAVEAADESMIVHLRSVNSAREAEVQRLRTLVVAKDREICNLYMHLSTKKTLVDELTSSFLQQVQNVAASRGESMAVSSLTRDDLDLNVDMFLFTNAVEKQKALDELTAALGVLEREVETLEARVETLESENYTLTVTHEDATSMLASANAELLRVSAENEMMETSLTEKQTRIRNLMLYLEEKEDQVMRLKDAVETQQRSASASAPRSSPGFATAY